MVTWCCSDLIDDQGKILILEHQRRLIENGQRAIFDHTVGLDVAEHGDLAEDLRLERLVAAQHDDIRRDAHALQFLDRVLGGLGFVLVAAAQEGDQRHMDEERVLLSLLQADLPGGLQKGLALDIAGRAADLGDDHVGLRRLSDAIDEVLDLLRDVRDDLHRLAEVLAAPLLVEHVPVHLAGGEVGIAVEVLVDEALIVAEIQVSLTAVLGHIDLAVLVGTHGPGVDVDVGVELLRGDLEAAALEQPPERGRRDPFAKPGYDAACHKHIFCHGNRLHLFIAICAYRF